MSSKDDPSGSDGRTVIRGSPRRASQPDTAALPPVPGARSDPTVIYTENSRQRPASATVIYQGVPFADGRPEAKATQPAELAPGFLEDPLFDAVDTVRYPAANPIMTAAAPLLMLLGHLRLTGIKIDAPALARHVASFIEEFEWKAADAGVTDEDARIARYALCETADDIIASLPGLGPNIWAQNSMLLRFYGVEEPGNGFCEALNTVLANPQERCDLLELMHACLSLGFEGPYRGASGQGTLEPVRQDVYAALRYFRPIADDDISPRWQGLSTTAPRRRARLPLWAIAATALTLVTGAYFWMRTDITREGDELAAKLLTLTPSTSVVIERADFVPLIEEAKPAASAATVTQVDRIRTALVQDIQSGSVSVGIKGEFIVVEINNAVLFEPGKAETRPEFIPVAGRIASAFRDEQGPIRIVGHTDNVRPRQSSTYKSNYDLSVARAEAVEKALAPELGETSRVSLEGKGEDEPIADNATPDGRAKNRRVEVMIRREDAL